MKKILFEKSWVLLFIFWMENLSGGTCPPKDNSSQLGGYNSSARIEIQKSRDFFGTASFLYWSPSQDNMSLGIVSDTSDSLYSLNGNFVQLAESYSPGFKVGLGMNFDRDGWDSFLQYTWFQSTEKIRTSLEAGGNKRLLPAYAIPKVSSPAFYNGSERWQLHIDFLDLELARHYFVGKDLSFRPFFGVRGAWIRQKVYVNYRNNVDLNDSSQNVSVNQKSDSWAVGPRAGLWTDWLLGKNFRMYGSGALDILFTQYTELSFYEQALTRAGVFVPGSLYYTNQKDDNHLRAHLELELGYGWGTYFSNKRWHIDLSAGYGFQVFFDQNMFHSFIDSTSLGKVIVPHGNLFIHGLTTTARFDF